MIMGCYDIMFFHYVREWLLNEVLLLHLFLSRRRIPLSLFVGLFTHQEVTACNTQPCNGETKHLGRRRAGCVSMSANDGFFPNVLKSKKKSRKKSWYPEFCLTMVYLSKILKGLHKIFFIFFPCPFLSSVKQKLHFAEALLDSRCFSFFLVSSSASSFLFSLPRFL